MTRMYWLLLASVYVLLGTPIAAFAGPVVDIQGLLNQSRAETMAMLSEADKTVLEMRYDDALASSKKLDVRLEQALSDKTQQTQRASLEKFKEIWEVFKVTRDKEIVPMLMSGKQDKARALAKYVQFPRFQKMNQILDAARTR